MSVNENDTINITLKIILYHLKEQDIHLLTYQIVLFLGRLRQRR